MPELNLDEYLALNDVYCNDVQGRVQLKHELNYKENKELRDRMNMIQTYVGMKVKLMFDPPVSSFALDALNKQIADYEWRITSEVACYGQ